MIKLSSVVCRLSSGVRRPCVGSSYLEILSSWTFFQEKNNPRRTTSHNLQNNKNNSKFNKLIQLGWEPVSSPMTTMVRVFRGSPRNREQGGDDSPTTTAVGAFGGSPLTRLGSSDLLNLPVRVQVSREGHCESSGQYTITRHEGEARTQSAQPNALGEGGRSRLLEWCQWSST